MLPIDTPVWLPETRAELRDRVCFLGPASEVNDQLRARGYATHAWLPNFETKSQAGTPVVETVSTATQWVTVVQVPPEVLERGRVAAADRSTERSRLLNAFAECLLESAKASVEAVSDVQPLGFARRDGGRLSTTWDRQIERFIGLHIDSWDRAPIVARGESRNRICLNLGDGPRSLMFVPISVMAFAPRLSLDQRVVNASDLGRAFLARHPETMIVEVTTMPGEAYIAPTETIIHDGSTRCSVDMDVSFTALGRFTPR